MVAYRINPKTIFLIDAIGAMLTAGMLLGVLKPFHTYIGMPVPIITMLALIAAIFFVLSISCFVWIHQNWQPYLHAISIANSMYCILSLSLVVIYFRQLTTLGITYFLFEISVIIMLVRVERKMLQKGYF
jgi:hypothetical protein